MQANRRPKGGSVLDASGRDRGRSVQARIFQVNQPSRAVHVKPAGFACTAASQLPSHIFPRERSEQGDGRHSLVYHLELAAQFAHTVAPDPLDLVI